MNSMKNNHKKRTVFGATRILLILLIISSILGCAGLPAPGGTSAKEGGWIALTALKTPTPIGVGRTVSTDKELKLSLQVHGFFKELVEEKAEIFHSIVIQDAGVMTEIGKPNLPVIRKLVAVPRGKTVKVSMTAGKPTALTNYNVYPVQPPVVEQETYRSEFTIDRKSYQSDQPYPGKSFSVSKPMILRGQPLVQVEIYPVQYIPAKKTLLVTTDMSYEIEFIDSTEATEADARPLAIELPYWKQLRRAVNFDWLIGSLVLRMDAQYLIITADTFAEEIAPLAEWKRTKGLSTNIVKMSTIGTTDEALRTYIRNVYNNAKVRPAYILLVGDVEYIPAHIYNSGSESCATDLFYAAVDGDDFLPDIAVGRFSAKTEADVTGMVTKTINYEKTPVQSPSEWYSRITLVSDQGYFENTSNWVYDFMTAKGYTADRFYSSTQTATPERISGAVNEGRVIVNYRGHGSVTGWGTGSFRNANVLALDNKRMTPVIISPTCQTGWYDNSSNDCFGETWLKAGGTNGEIGAVDFWGSSRNSYGGYNDELCKGVYKASFDDGISAFGDITNQAKLYMYDVYGTSSMCQLEFNLFNVLGDPELTVWFQKPTVLAEGWSAIDLDVLGGVLSGGVTKETRPDVGNQNAFPVLRFPYSSAGTPSCFVAFSVPSDWDGESDFLVEFIWFSPEQDGNVKWSIVHDRKDVSVTPYDGFNRHLKYALGARRERVSNHSIELWSQTSHGAINPGDVITLGLERFRYNPNESGVENAITSDVYLIASRVLYRTKD